jgi:hypothetical protein
VPDHPPSPQAAAQTGLAHVATSSFLASRVVPTGGYAVALAGGVALARSAQMAGARAGYGASIAAMLQAIAVLGPSRVSVPLTQALSAPLLGRLHARGTRLGTQIGVCAAIRAADQIVLSPPRPRRSDQRRRRRSRPRSCAWRGATASSSRP